nr:oxidoreductase [Planobispora longispora]
MDTTTPAGNARRWTADRIPDQTGRTFIVTGANSGLGYSTARELARRGAHVIMAVRNEAKGQQAIKEIEASAGRPVSLELRRVDLADLDSVRTFAEALRADGAGVDVLINNAGVMMPPRSLSPQGHESQFAANHLGHFALTGLLLDVIAAAGTPGGHGQLDHAQAREDPLRRPDRGALLLARRLLLAVEVRQHPLRAGAGPPVEGRRITGAQPAGAPRLLRHQPADHRSGRAADEVDHAPGQPALRPARGRRRALPALRGDLPDARGGQYIGPDGWMENRGHPKVVRPIRAATDPADARRLWELSEELTGVRYGLPETA